MYTLWGKLLSTLNSMARLSMINQKQDLIMRKKVSTAVKMDFSSIQNTCTCFYIWLSWLWVEVILYKWFMLMKQK